MFDYPLVVGVTVKVKSFGAEVTEQTAAYLTALESCVQTLPELLEALPDGDPTSPAQQIRSLESDCDSFARRLSRQLADAEAGDADLLSARLYMNGPSITSLYLQLDEVANITERIADELLALDPPTDSGHYRALTEMVELAVEATAILSDAVSTLIDCLGPASGSATITTEVTEIRRLEAKADRRRDALISAAFEEGPTERALLWRELAQLFDSLLDTVEDVSDQLVVLSTAVPELVAAPSQE